LPVRVHGDSEPLTYYPEYPEPRMEVAIKNQGRHAMTMGQTKVRGYARKPAEHFGSKKYPFDAVLAIEASDNSEAAIRARLSEDLKSVSAGETRYAINLSLGAVRINICSNASIGEWMVRADQAMYEQKRRRLSRLPEPSGILQTTLAP